MYLLSCVERDGHTVQYLSVPAQDPAAPLVLWTHGFPGDAFDWSWQLRSVAGRFHHVAPFMPGVMSGEPPPRARLSVASLVDDLSAVVRAADPAARRRLYLVGHDLGCFFNVALAERAPQRVSGIVNINGLGLAQYGRRLARPGTWLRSSYVLATLLGPVRRLVASVMPAAFLALIYNLAGVAPKDELRRRGRRVLAGIAVYPGLVRHLAGLLGRPVVKLSVPTLFIWGNRDVFLAVPRPSEVARFYTDAVVRVVKGGHWVSRSSPAHVNAILAKTLAGWEARSAPDRAASPAEADR